MLSCQSPKIPKKSIESTTRAMERTPATAKVIQAPMAMTPSQPIWGTGRGKAGMLTSFCRNTKTLLNRSPMKPSTPPKNQLSGPCSCTQSRTELSQSWKSVVSWSPRARVLLALQEGVEHQPDDHDTEEHQPGVAVLDLPDVRLLFLGRRRAPEPPEVALWRWPRQSPSSATTTRRMSSSSTTPTTLSPSTTRHGPWWLSTTRAASRTIWSYGSAGAVCGYVAGVGPHHPLQGQHVRLGHLADEVADVVVGRARRPPRRACRSGRSRRHA